MRPFLDKAAPEAWNAARKSSDAVGTFAAQAGLAGSEAELINVRASQLNGCVFCLDLHSRQARRAGVPQQKLDTLPAWRETDLNDERERAVLAIAEAVTRLPLTEEAEADLAGARSVLGDTGFAAAEWVAAMINLFNRVSVLSQHPVRPRDADGKVIG